MWSPPASPRGGGEGGGPPATPQRRATFVDVESGDGGGGAAANGGPRLQRGKSFSDLVEEGLAASKHRSRSRVALLDTGEGEMVPVDAQNLDLAQQRALMASLQRKAEKEAFDVLQRERERLERVGITHPRITVRYKNLTVSAFVRVGHRLMPSLASPLRLAKRTKLPILEAASGVLAPGRFTLLLGPPGSGKTTLLQTLAGINRKARGLRITADELTYNGHTFPEFVVERSAAYVSQYDMHYGELTVRETFDFSARCQSTGYRRALVEEVVAREAEAGIEPDPELDAFLKALAHGKKQNLMVEVVIQALDLIICADTLVGNAMLRGISGGQRKRVTTGEMIVGPTKAMFLDEISTGLDSSTTFTIMSQLRRFAHVMGATILCGLLQPQPETYETFDDVVLISAGKICFHGPREMVLPFFEGLGFACPERHGVADFLQEVTTSTDQQKYWSVELGRKPYRFVNAKTFQDAFLATDRWREMAAALDAPFNRAASDPHALAHTRYGTSYRDLLCANFQRTLIMQHRSLFVMGIRLFQLTLMAFVVATLFLQTPQGTVADGQIYFSVIFFSVLFMIMGAIGEMHMLVERMAVVYRQRDALFYPGWCFALPAFVMRLPWAVMETSAWSLIVYFAVGFSSSVRFLMFWLQLFVVNTYSTSLFQAVAAIAQDDTIAISIASFLLLLLVNTTGFVLNANSIPRMWISAFWANPYAWTTRAVGINELTSPHWGAVGPQVLEFRGFPTSYGWVWGAIGFNLCTMALNLAVFVWACTYLTAPKRHAPMTPEAMEELRLARAAAPRAPADGRRTRLSSVGSGGVLGTKGSATGADLEMQVVAGANMERISQATEASAAYREHTAIKFEPIWMTFRDVEYSVPVPRDTDTSKVDVPVKGPHAGQLRLLYKVSSVFRPQVLCALMGASGAGKTTLMDVLAGRKTGGVITGAVHLNGFPKDQATFARLSGYVEQTDVHLPETTVEEAVQFSARLRLPSTTDALTRHAFVEEIMELVDLADLRHAHVGRPGVSGLSVEQRKRLTIAVELAANPSIVFMDEPTSGLDARAANIVMRTIRDTVDTGRTCVCTIHQPSVDIFEAFDEMLLLKPGGRTIYFGPLGEGSASLIAYLSAVPGVAPIKPRYNAAAWMLEETTPAAEKALGVDFAEEYRTSELAARMNAVIAQYEAPAPGAAPLSRAGMALPGTAAQFQANLARFWKAYYRNPAYNFTRFVTTTFVSLVFGSMFWEQGAPENRSTVGGVLNIAGVIFMGTLFVGIGNCMTVQPMIFMQREVFYRERAVGMLSVLPYTLAQQLVEVPYLVLQNTVATSIMYWMIGFVASGTSFLWFWFLFLLSLAFFTLWGMLGVALAPVLQLANVLVAFFFGFWNLLAGFLLQRPDIPGWWIWAYWLTPCNYQIQSLVTSQLGGLNDEYILNTFTSPPINQTIPEFLEQQFGYQWSFLWPSVAIQLTFIAIPSQTHPHHPPAPHSATQMGCICLVGPIRRRALYPLSPPAART